MRDDYAAAEIGGLTRTTDPDAFYRVQVRSDHDDTRTKWLRISAAQLDEIAAILIAGDRT